MLIKVLPPEFSVNIVEADSGPAGIAICEARIIDVLFLDLTMPGMDGFGVLDALKNHPGRPKVTIVVSADIQPRTQTLALLKGAFEFVPKPATTQAIRKALTSAGFL